MDRCVCLVQATIYKLATTLVYCCKVVVYCYIHNVCCPIWQDPTVRRIYSSLIPP